MSDAGGADHPGSRTSEGHGGGPLGADTGISGLLIIVGVVLIAVPTVGTALSTLFVGLLYCGGRGCSVLEGLPALAVLFVGLFAIWAGRAALRGRRVGMIGVALCGGATVVAGVGIAVASLYLGTQPGYRLYPELLATAAVVGLAGVLLLAGVRGRLLQQRRDLPPPS